MIPPRIITDVPSRPPRLERTHKGQSGHVAIVAGSRGMSGAAVLCGLGALRAGAGLVRVCCGQSLQPIIAAGEPCFMTAALPEDEAGRTGPRLVPEMSDSLAWSHALAIGPGLGQSPALATAVEELLSTYPRPIVLDADGLNNVAAVAQPWWEARRGRVTIITPHPGEMARLQRAANLAVVHAEDDEARLRSAAGFAARTGVTVVLKGHRTVVCDPGPDEQAARAYVNTTGNSGMAAGGMGDVLTGLIAALLAQGMSAFDAARLGVYAHGLAADRIAERVARIGYLAREVADMLPSALADASQPRIGFR